MKHLVRLTVTFMFFIVGMTASPYNMLSHIWERYPYLSELEEPAIICDFGLWEVVITQTESDYIATIYRSREKMDVFKIDMSQIDNMDKPDNPGTQEHLEWGFNLMPMQYISLLNRKTDEKYNVVGWYMITYYNPDKEVIISIERSESMDENTDFEVALSNLRGVCMKLLVSSDKFK